MTQTFSHRRAAFTLIEMLVVISIIAILFGLSFPVFRIIKEKANVTNEINSVRSIAVNIYRFASENNQILPSPEVDLGFIDNISNQNEKDEQLLIYDTAGTGSGLWLDGWAFYATKFWGRPDVDKWWGSESKDGSHIKDTEFMSKQSFRINPLETDYYKHSYAMNKSLQYDYRYANEADPDLTSKNLSRIPFQTNALLLIENEEKNVISNEDRDAIIETGDKRWSSGQPIAAFVDSSIMTLHPNEIPDGDIKTDRESSRFWRGVDPD